MLKTLLSLSACLALVAATPFRDCGSTSTVTELRVPGCNTLPCVIGRGTNVTIEVDFTSNSASSTIDVDLTGTFLGITAPWPGTLPPACTTLVTGDCPLVAGEAVTFQAILVIESEWPAVTATASLKLLGDNSASLVCVQVPLNLV